MFARLTLTLALLAAPAAGQLVIPQPEPVLTLVAADGTQALFPQDIAAMETSESGGITDIFVRLRPDATEGLATLTEQAQGEALQVIACGHILMAPIVQGVIDSGTIYIPDTNATRAEALRALWSGRSVCTDINPEVFQHGP
jgi:hypothetical protein